MIKGSSGPIVERLKKANAIAPHSGAIRKNESRSTNASGYYSQKMAHDAMREEVKTLSDSSQSVSIIHAALHMAASHINVIAHGKTLENSLTHGYSALGHIGNLENSDQAALLAKEIHERREQAKINIKAATMLVPKEIRDKIPENSPIREPMSHGGGYINKSFSWEHPKNNKKVQPLNEKRQKELAGKLLQPLLENEFPIKSRSLNEFPRPFSNSRRTENRRAFEKQTPHIGGIGRAASEDYRKKVNPGAGKVRVKAMPSPALYKSDSSGKKGTASGLHEVVPTDMSRFISAISDSPTRNAIGVTQGIVRTGTALTIFRADPSKPTARARAGTIAIAIAKAKARIAANPGSEYDDRSDSSSDSDSDSDTKMKGKKSINSKTRERTQISTTSSRSHHHRSDSSSDSDSNNKMKNKKSINSNTKISAPTSVSKITESQKRKRSSISRHESQESNSGSSSSINPETKRRIGNALSSIVRTEAQAKKALAMSHSNSSDSNVDSTSRTRKRRKIT